MENLVPILESPHRQDAITLVRINNPLNPMIDRKSKVIDYFGESILTIKDNYFPTGLPVIASVNGKIVQDCDLGSITLKHGDYLVFYPTIEGGSGGMRMVAFLALAIISAFVAPYLTGLMGGMMTVGGTVGGALTATGMMVSGMIGMAMNFVGGMIINALLPPTTPEQTSGKTSTAYSFSPHSTQAIGIPLPKIYGVLKSHGNIITAFNYNIKDKSTANVLVSFGSGPIEDIYDYKINDQRMGNTKDITFGERHGELHQEVIPAFTETKSENPYSLRIRHVSDWTRTKHLIDTSVVAYDSALQGWKLTALNDGKIVDTDYAYPFPSTIVEGSTYTDSTEGVVWTCEGKYPYETTTTGNDFDALEIEFNFPRGLVRYDDEGNAGTVSIDVDVQVTPAGQDNWYSITRKPKTMATWTPGMGITADSIISSPQGSGLYKILYLSPSTTRTGLREIAFNTQPFSCTVESVNDSVPLSSWIKAYIGNSSGPTTGTYDDDGVDISSQLNGNVLNNGYPLQLNTTGKYLYCLLDNNMTSYYSTGMYLMSYVITGASGGAVHLKAEYKRRRDGAWTSLGNDGQHFSTNNDFRLDYMKIANRKNTYWMPSTFDNYGSGHWVRFSFTDVGNGYPVMGLLRPQKANTGATDGLIIYTEARKNYAYSSGIAPNNGTWSAGYWTTTSGYLEDYSLWVEAVTTSDHTYRSHNNGDDYRGSGWNDWDKRGAFWRYITTDCYVIFANNLEQSKKISARTQKSLFFTVRTPNIYPHGYYDIKIDRITADANPKRTNITDEMYLSNIREIVYDDFSYPRHALLGIKALATEKLSGSLDISAIVKGLVTQVNRPDEVIGSNGYNYRCKTYLPSPSEASHMPITGSSWSTYWEQGGSSAVENNITFSAVTNYSATPTWVTEYTTNPAWVCYDILSQPVIGMPTEVTIGDYSFECVISHTATSLNKPISGQDWSKYWQIGGDIGIGDTWITSTVCSARPIIRYEGIDPSRLVLSSFKTLADYCDELVYDENGTLERRHEFNGIFDAEMTLWEAALKVTEMCRSSLIWNGMNIAVVTDVKATLPTDAVQLFTSGNILPDSFKETFLPMEERVSEVEISFLNRAKDWERDTISIYNPDSVTLSNKASIEPLGITKASQAWRHAQYLVNRNKYLKKTIEFETDLEAIACTVGDIFYFQNDVPRWGMAGGRLAADSHDGVILQLDQNITISATGSYGMMVRHNDDTLETKEISTLLGPELLTNGDFESGPIDNTDSVYGWTDTGYSTITVQFGGKYGNYLQLAATGFAYQSAYQDVGGKLLDGHLYRLSYWAKDGTLASQTTDMTLYSTTREYRTSTLTTSTDWQKRYKDIVFTEVAGETTYCYIEKTTANLGTVLYDEVSIREILTDKPVGGNLLTDGSFEGNLTTWIATDCTITNTAITGVSGKGLKLSTTTAGTAHCISQSFPVTQGKRYRLSFWVKDGSPTNQAFYGYFTNGSWSHIDVAISGVSSATWTQYTSDFTCTGDEDANGYVLLYKYNASVGYILFDEVRLFELESASGNAVEVASTFSVGRIGQTNLVSNGTFETDTTGWTGTNCTLSIGTGLGVDGGNCLVATQTGSTFYYPYCGISVIPGRRYTFSAWVKQGTDIGASGYLSYWSASSSVEERKTLTTSSVWTKIEYSFVANNTGNLAALLVFESGTGTTLWDEVEVYESAYPTQYAPYAIGTLDSEAKAFRAINISQSSEQRAKITAIEYDADVYADDEEVALPDTGDTWTEAVKIRPVTDLALMEIPSIGTSDTVGKRSITISFKRPIDDFNYRTARVWYKYNRIDEEDTSSDAWALLTETSGITATIPEVIPNYRYTVCVTSVSKDNIESLWDESPKAAYIVSDVSFQSIMLLDTRVTGLQIIGNPNSTTFIGTDCSISWNPSIVLAGNTVAGGVANSTNLMESGIAFTTSDVDSIVAESNKLNPNDVTGVGTRLYQSPNAKGAGISIPQTWFKDYEVNVYNYDTGALLRTEYVTDNFYTYTYDKNYVDNQTQLATQLQIDVKARDVNLNSSIASTLIAYNPNIYDPVTIDRISNAGVGDNLLIASDTLSRNASTTYTLIKEIRLAIAGNYRISFDLCTNSVSGNPVSARIYKNGVAIGTERTTTSIDPAYVTYTEDINGWEATDLCQIWAKRVSTVATAKVINFRVYELAPIIPIVSQDLDFP